jgi:hypothetical protein
MSYPAKPPPRSEWIGILAVVLTLAATAINCVRGTMGQGDEHRIGAVK